MAQVHVSTQPAVTPTTPGTLGHFVWASLVIAALVGLAGLLHFVGLPPLPHATAQAVAIADTQVPAAPAQPLDRIYLYTTLSNQGSLQVDKVTLQLEVVAPDGKTVVTSKQSSIGLEGHGRREIAWAWRIPGGLEPGSYGVRITALGSDGQQLATTPSPLPKLEVVPR